MLSDKIIAIQLYKKNKVEQFNLGLSEPNLAEDKLKQVLCDHLKQISTVTFYPFDSIDKKMITADMVKYHAIKTFEEYDQRQKFIVDYEEKQR